MNRIVMNGLIFLLLSHPFVQTNPLFARELQWMREKAMKVELESVYCHGIEYFSKTYMKEKVLEALSTFSLLFVCSLILPSHSNTPSSTWSSLNSVSDTFHTCTLPSSAIEANTSAWTGCHRISFTVSEWPRWVKSNSAAPSSSSSADCSCPIYLWYFKVEE